MLLFIGHGSYVRPSCGLGDVTKPTFSAKQMSFHFAQQMSTKQWWHANSTIFILLNKCQPNKNVTKTAFSAKQMSFHFAQQMSTKQGWHANSTIFMLLNKCQPNNDVHNDANGSSVRPSCGLGDNHSLTFVEQKTRSRYDMKLKLQDWNIWI